MSEANALNSNLYLPFEKNLYELDVQIRRLEDLSKRNNLDFGDEIGTLSRKREEMARDLFSRLTPWQKVLVARHPARPQTLDYVEAMCEEFVELRGDRCFADDRAVVTGLARIGGRRIMLVGQHKGRDVRERNACNSGCPHPEGYRKAILKMRLAEKFGLPIVSMIDTKGAFPGIGAEERGQSRAIAQNLQEMSVLRTPIVCVVIGEGGSGGALGIGVGDRLLMLEHAYYSVITPEGCAAILWKDHEKKEEAAAALKLTSADLKAFGIVDEIIPEPVGGAHRYPKQMAETLKGAIIRHLDELAGIPPDELVEARYERLRKTGAWRTAQAAGVEVREPARAR